MKTLILSFLEDKEDYINGDTVVNVKDDVQVEKGNVITIIRENWEVEPYLVDRVLNEHFKYWNRLTGELHNNSNTVRQIVIKNYTVQVLAKNTEEFIKTQGK